VVLSFENEILSHVDLTMMMMMMMMMMMVLSSVGGVEKEVRSRRVRSCFVEPEVRENAWWPVRTSDCDVVRPRVNEMWRDMWNGEISSDNVLKEFINMTEMYKCADAPFSAGTLSLMGGRPDVSSRFHVESVKRSRGMQREILPIARYQSMNRTVIQGLELRVASRAKIRHDAEQIRYLISENLISSSYERAARTLDNIYSALPENWIGYLPKERYSKIGSFFNRLLYYDPPKRLPIGEPMFGYVDLRRAREEYRINQVTVIDNLLSPRALRVMRKWLMESTFWFDSNPQGYVGAYFEQGFTSPFLLQMIQELKNTFQEILGHHKINEVWAYKYDSQGKGIKVHADTAAVNLNFWVTPDDANLNKENGGLVIYSREAPMEWNFQDFNSERGLPRMMEFLKDSDLVRVPYRQNRLVIFNSNLFHYSDKFEFKSGYGNRRINLTFLFGKRGEGKLVVKE